MVRGIPLPRLGSFEYFVLSEGLRRERTEKVAFAKMVGSILGAGIGVEKDEIDTFVQEYAEEVFQLKYNYKYKSALARKLAEKVEQRVMEQQLLDRVNRMTVQE